MNRILKVSPRSTECVPKWRFVRIHAIRCRLWRLPPHIAPPREPMFLDVKVFHCPGINFCPSFPKPVKVREALPSTDRTAHIPAMRVLCNIKVALMLPTDGSKTCHYRHSSALYVYLAAGLQKRSRSPHAVRFLRTLGYTSSSQSLGSELRAAVGRSRRLQRRNGFLFGPNSDMLGNWD
jgi:hypothetical protein